MASSTEARPKARVFDKQRILGSHPLFAGLGQEVIDRLSSHAAFRTVRRGAMIFAKGDPGSSLFAIRSGTVKISVPSADGKDAVFRLLGENAIFGEIALLDGRPRTADATAMTDCELMVIDRRDFLPLLQSQPEIALKLVVVLCERLRHTSEQVEDVMFLDLPGRLAKILLHLAESAAPSPQGRRIAVTQREIGQIIGMSRESTNKQLRNWEEKKLVRLERGTIVVVSPAALAEIARSSEERSSH